MARAGRPACCVMLPPAPMAYREREEGGFLGGFPVSGCAGVAALFTSFSLSIFGPSIPVVFAAAGSGSRSLAIPCSCCLRVWAYHWLFLCPRACGLCVWWRWRPPWWRVAPVPRFRGGARPSCHRVFPLGIPSYHSFFALNGAFCGWRGRGERLLRAKLFQGGVGAQNQVQSRAEYRCTLLSSSALSQ